MEHRLETRARIAVLGAGSSGITFASTLRSLGYRDTVVFERAGRVGGKCFTVELDGRSHDLGATMGVPIDYQRVVDFSDAAGIETLRFPREQHFSLATGRTFALNRKRALPAVLSQTLRYIWLHKRRWRGADGSGLHRAPAELFQPWARVASANRLELASQRMLAYRTGYGYGYDDEVPAVLHANLIRPQTLRGLAFGHSFMWRGGTEAIWRHAASELDVRLSTTITSIARHSRGVSIAWSCGSERFTEDFDAVVITFNPEHALGLLDSTAEEREMFSGIRTYPYATFACRVSGLMDGEASVGYIDENMRRDRPGHPMAWVKRHADQDIFVFHLFAPDELDDEAITGRIAADVRRLGGRFESLCAARRWEFFPHFTSQFMQGGGLARVERWQGSARTYLIGEVLSFATMARVTELATSAARALARDGLKAGGREIRRPMERAS